MQTGRRSCTPACKRLHPPRLACPFNKIQPPPSCGASRTVSPVRRTGNVQTGRKVRRLRRWTNFTEASVDPRLFSNSKKLFVRRSQIEPYSSSSLLIYDLHHSFCSPVNVAQLLPPQRAFLRQHGRLTARTEEFPSTWPGVPASCREAFLPLPVCDLDLFMHKSFPVPPALPVDDSLVTMMYSLSTYKLFLSQYYLLLTFNKILKLIFHCRREGRCVCVCVLFVALLVFSLVCV